MVPLPRNDSTYIGLMSVLVFCARPYIITCSSYLLIRGCSNVATVFPAVTPLTCCLLELLQFVASVCHPGHEGSEGHRDETTVFQSEATNYYFAFYQHTVIYLSTNTYSQLINPCALFGIYDTLSATTHRDSS